MALTRSENCSGVKRIHGFGEIFIFLNHLHQFLTSLRDLNCPCACITLRAGSLCCRATSLHGSIPLGLFLPPPCYPTLIARTPATHSFVLSISTGTDLCKSSRSLPGRGGPGGKTADSGRLQILIDFLFKSGRFGAVSASGRPGADSGRFRTAPKEDLETTGTEDRDASPERRSEFQSP